MMENDAIQRSILISGITREINFESILGSFSDYNVTGGGVIQSYEFYSPNKMRITYFYHKDAERVLSRGTTYKIGKTYLHVSRFSQDVDSSDSSNSSLVTAIVNSSRENTPLEVIKPIDQKRILLTNVPNSIDKEYLDLYLEYLSDEVEIERIDVGQEIAGSIVVTYSKFIDFENLKKKHKQRPRILKNTTAVLPVYLPNTVVLELENDKTKKSLEKHLTSEILELYFSNKKRSGGHNVKSVRVDPKKNLVYVSFENFETAKQVCNRPHVINNLDLRARLYYENIGPDPFSMESKIYSKKLHETPFKVEKVEESKSDSQTPVNKSPFEKHQINSIPIQIEKRPELTKLVNVLQPTLANKVEYADKSLVDTSDSHQSSSYTVESTLNIDLPKNPLDKPKVNLPSLDDPILSFEEYAILNNITQKPDNKYQLENHESQILGNHKNAMMIDQMDRKVEEKKEQETEKKRIDLTNLLGNQKQKDEKRKSVYRNEDEYKNIMIGGAKSARFPSPPPDTKVVENRRDDVTDLLTEEANYRPEADKLYTPRLDVPQKPKNSREDKHKTINRREDEYKNVGIGGKSARFPSPPPDPKVIEKRREEVFDLLTEEANYRPEAEKLFFQRKDSNPKNSKEENRRRGENESKYANIGGAKSARFPSPPPDPNVVDKRREDIIDALSNQKAKDERRKSVHRTEDEYKNIMIGGTKSARFPSPPPDPNVVDKRREDVIDALSNQKSKDERRKSVHRTEDEYKNIMIGGAKSARFPSPPPDPKFVEERREGVTDLLTEEANYRPEADKLFASCSIPKQPQTFPRSAVIRTDDEKKGFVIGGKYGGRAWSPDKPVDDNRRVEIEKLFDQSKRNSIRINTEFQDAPILGGARTARPLSPEKTLDPVTVEKKRSTIENVIVNDKVKIKEAYYPPKPKIVQRNETEAKSYERPDKEQFPNKAFDLTTLQEKNVVEGNPKFEEKVDAIRKLLEDPNYERRNELENLLYGTSKNVFSQASPENKFDAKLRLSSIPDKFETDAPSQTIPVKLRVDNVPPVPKLVQKDGLNNSLQSNHVSFGPQKPAELNTNKVILKQRPYSSVEPSFYNRDSNELKENLNKNHIISQYGNQTTADSINRLSPKSIEFLKSNSYLDKIRKLYPKVNINLNVNQKRLYFFGALKQVSEAKDLIKKDLDSIKTTLVRLNRKELALYLDKNEIKNKLAEFFRDFVLDKDKRGANVNSKFFIYEIVTKTIKETNSEEYWLNVHTNCGDYLPIFHEYVNKNVMVELKLEINSSHLSDSIKNEDSKWEELYTNKYESLIDYKLEFHKIRNKLKENVVEQKCFLKLTGFKDFIDQFQNDLTVAYKLKKVS